MSKGPLIGCDIYHGNMPFSRTFGDFQIHKAAEGKTFVDSDFKKWTEEYTGLKGAYHFAGKYINETWQSQMNNFLNTLHETNFCGIIVLDLESSALEETIKNPSGALNWLSEIWIATETQPFLYTNTYGTQKLDVRFAAYPLWIASYDKKEPVIDSRFLQAHTSHFGTPYFIWQLISKPFDIDLANMTELEWIKRSY